MILVWLLGLCGGGGKQGELATYEHCFAWSSGCYGTSAEEMVQCSSPALGTTTDDMLGFDNYKPADPSARCQELPPQLHGCISTAILVAHFGRLPMR